MYDYVIAGAGSAGCVLAARLGEDPDVRVAVIEAGPPDSEPEIHVPFAFGLLLKSRFDWDLVSEPEPGLDHRRNYLPRGRVLGGSSSLNAMICIRGHRSDFDEGRRSVSTDGATTTSCRTSSGPRTTSAAQALPRRRRPAERQRRPLAAPARRRVHRGGRRGRDPDQRRPQWRGAGGGRPLPAHAARRTPSASRSCGATRSSRCGPAAR